MSNRIKDLLIWAGLVVLVILAILVSRYRFARFDLTEDKRFTLSETTVELIQRVEDPLLITLYLDGEDLPMGFQRLKEETVRMLDEFQALNSNIEYIFVDPSESPDAQVRRDTYQQLQNAGLGAIAVNSEENGGTREQYLFPGAIASYKDKEWSINLLQQQFATAPEAQINASIENLEYNLSGALRGLTATHRPRIALVDGHGELSRNETESFENLLGRAYDVQRFNLKEFEVNSADSLPNLQNQLLRLNTFDLLVIAKPTQTFLAWEQWLLDQYLMNDGRVILMMDAVQAEMDSLSYGPEFLAYPISGQIGLSDQLFTYGARVTTSLVQDMVCGGVNDGKAILPWVYFPIFLPQSQHPISKNLNAIRMEFGTTIDTIRVAGVKKTPLLFSSPYSKRQPTPGRVSLATLYSEPDESLFNEGPFPTAVLFEGAIPSHFSNRLLPDAALPELIPAANNAKLLVISDGDFIRNQTNKIRPDLPRGLPLPTGYDQFTQQQYGNGDFILNAIDYMLDGTGLIEVRGRSVILRLLDMPRVEKERVEWEVANALGPIVLILLFGFGYQFYRHYRFAKRKA